ncbi:MAG: HEAT repeat domain-containing protein [Verrucomicrobiota bacterium]|jgi:HEAT repeat protein
MTLKLQRSAGRALLLLCATAALAFPPALAQAAESEPDLIKVLQSGAPAGEKGVACKKLAVFGSKAAVPALAPLLEDKDLASWARIALEAIPDPAAGDALRAALDKVSGRLLVGVLNSIGVRRDAGAVDSVIPRLKDTDAEVVTAAAVALGRIGGDPAAAALKSALASAPAGAKAGVAQGCILCADRFLAAGQAPAAMALFDLVRQTNVLKQRQIEATRGAILARESSGLPLLLEQLRSPDKAWFRLGLRVARELPGRDVTDALTAELDRLPAERRPLLLLAVADRTDDGVMAALHKAIESDVKPLQLAALGVLQHAGHAACVPALLHAATDADADIAKAAKLALEKIEDPAVDAALLARLKEASGQERRVLIEVAGERRTAGALSAIVPCLADPDAAVRATAVAALGSLGEAPQAADLAGVLTKAATPAEREEVTKALVALSSRVGAATVPYLMPLAKSGEPALRIAALQAFAAAGGPAALTAVAAAVNDADEGVQDEAVRTLSTWPNSWPDDSAVASPLLALAKSGKKASHQVLGVRGYLQFVQVDKQLKDDERVARINELLPSIQRPEEKRAAIATLGGIPSAAALDALLGLGADPALAGDAYSAVVQLASTDLRNSAKEACRKALETVLAKSGDEATKKKAEKTLSKIK